MITKICMHGHPSARILRYCFGIMEIRIDITSEGSETIVCIAGRLFEVSVPQIRKACDPIEGVFVVDLSNLLFADDAGIDVIHTIVEKGAEVRGASPFIQLLLDDTPR